MTEKEQVPPSPVNMTTASDKVVDAVSALAAMIPILGGPISNVLAGLVNDRKFERVGEVLSGLARQIRTLSAESETFVKSVDFEDLMDQTLRQVARTRHRKKRDLYRDVLVGVIQRPSFGFDELETLMRTMDQVQVEHLLALDALVRGEEGEPPLALGGEEGTVEAEIGQSHEVTTRLLEELQGMGLLENVAPLPSSGKRSTIWRATGYGKRFRGFVLDTAGAQSPPP